MSFIGQLYQLVFKGGFNANANLEYVPPGDLTDGSRNINLHNGGLEKRGGTARVNGTQISGSPASLGIGQLIKMGTGTKHIYVAGTDGKLYRDYVSIATGRSQVNKNNFTVIDDNMFICNVFDSVQVDTGSSIAAITTPATDWTGNAHPTKIVVHGRGASLRAFGWGVLGKENILYYSTLRDYQEFNSGTSGTIVMTLPKGSGIIDCISIDENLLIRTTTQDYWFADSDASIANWGYFKAGWSGGVHSPQLSVQIYNDVYSMAPDGDIYTLSRAEEIRNYKLASISRPVFIHKWLKDNADLTKLNQFHMAFDPKIQAIKIWIVRSGETQCDTCLVYYIHERRWAPPHDAQDNRDDSGYEAAASVAVTIDIGDEQLYTMDYNGYVWSLEKSNKSDNSNAYTSIALTSWLSLDTPGIQKRLKYAIIHYISKGSYDLDIRWWADGAEQTTQSIALAAVGNVLGTFELDTDTLGVLTLTQQEFDTLAEGEKFRFQLSNTGAGEDFFISHLIIPFISRGHRRI